MPAHLCQLKNLRRRGENGSPSMYRPMLNEPTIASASSQWNAIATTP